MQLSRIKICNNMLSFSCLGNYLQEIFWEARTVPSSNLLVPADSGSSESKNSSFEMWDRVSASTRVIDQLNRAASKLQWGPRSRGTKRAFIYRRTETNYDQIDGTYFVLLKFSSGNSMWSSFQAFHPNLQSVFDIIFVMIYLYMSHSTF